jgi:dUTP pyrophosphatase
MIDVLDTMRWAIGVGVGINGHVLREAADEIERLRGPYRAQLAGHPVVRWKRVGSPDLEPPKYETEGAAGADLRADIANMERLGLHMSRIPPRGEHPWKLVLSTGGKALIPCGFAFAITDGYEGQVRGRSSFTKRGILCPTGTIDSDYRSVVSTYVWNMSSEPVEIAHGDRISQLIIGSAPRARFEEAEELTSTVRGGGGYGSTGVR